MLTVNMAGELKKDLDNIQTTVDAFVMACLYKVDHAKNVKEVKEVVKSNLRKTMNRIEFGEKKSKNDSTRDPKDWQKQYEMQKAKAMERLTAVKNGTATDTNVSGLSGLIPSKNPMNSNWKKEGGNQVLKRTLLLINGFLAIKFFFCSFLSIRISKIKM